jgi:hypothetical protein
MPMAPMFNWSLGAIPGLKMAKAWLFKVDANKLPPAMMADFCKKSLRELISLVLFGCDKFSVILTRLIDFFDLQDLGDGAMPRLKNQRNL